MSVRLTFLKKSSFYKKAARAFLTNVVILTLVFGPWAPLVPTNIARADAPAIAITSPTEGQEVEESSFVLNVDFGTADTCFTQVDSGSLVPAGCGAGTIGGMPTPSIGAHSITISGSNGEGSDSATVNFTIIADSGGGGGGDVPGCMDITADNYDAGATVDDFSCDFTAKDNLDATVAGAAALIESDWTPETWSVLADALALPETTYAEIVAKTSAINTGTAGLAPIDEGGGGGGGDPDPLTVTFASPTPSDAATVTDDHFEIKMDSSAVDDVHYAFTNFNDSILGWWRFENNANASIGLSNGTWSGTEAYTPGKFGTAGDFDGATRYVDATIPDISGGSFTVSAWVYLNSVNESSALVSDATGQLIQIGGGGVWQFDNIFGSATATTGAWTHLVGVYDALNDTEYLYMNGTLVVSGGGTRSLGTDINIGRRQDGNYIDGKIDDVLLVGRALSGAEVSSLYDATATQYDNTFSSLVTGDYTLKGYAADADGNENETEQRTVTLSTASEPITTDVGTCSDFEHIGDNLAGSYTVTDDLPCAGEGNAMMIGDSGHPFTGTLDGGGHTITVAIDAAGDDTGLFAYTEGATISAVRVAGTVTGTGTSVGGLVGNAGTGTMIDQVANKANVRGHFNTGGIAGSGNNITITNSYNRGAVSSNNEDHAIGGILGYADGSGLIDRNYNAGTVGRSDEFRYYIGGILGWRNSAGITVSNNFNAGAIQSTYPVYGGITGAEIPSNGSLAGGYSNNFFDITRSGVSMCVSDSFGNPLSVDGQCQGVNGDGSAPDYFISGFTNPPLGGNGDPSNDWDTGTIWETVDGGYPALQAIAGDEDAEPVPFDGGDGLTDETAYQISTCRQLQQVDDSADNLAAHYILEGDLTCATVTDFFPLARQMDGADLLGGFTGFTGVFNGNNHTIWYNKHIREGIDDNKYLGLFGYVNGGTIKNLSVTMGMTSLSGTDHIGGLAGLVSNGTIINDQSDVSISGSSYVGGLIGEINDGTTVTHSSATGSVSASGTAAGGLVGQNSGEVTETVYVSRSFATGDVSGQSNVGGLIGYSSQGVIENAYAEGDVADTEGGQVGGLVGGLTLGGIMNSYASGNVTQTGGLAGGLVGGTFAGVDINNSFATGANGAGVYGLYGSFNAFGIPDGAITLENNYYDSQTSAEDTCFEGSSLDETGCTSEDVDPTTNYWKNAANHPILDWDRISVWNLDSESNYPWLFDASHPDDHPGTNSNDFADGDGSRADPYQITTCAMLENILGDMTAAYILNNDINCGGQNIASIGHDDAIAFSGTLDGGSHRIYNFGINYYGEHDIGLFYALDGATIEHLTVGDPYHLHEINGNYHVGTLAGSAEGSTITDVTSKMTVIGRSFSIGGLIGTMDTTTIAGSSFLGQVQTSWDGSSVQQYIGGFAGSATDSTITNGTLAGSVILDYAGAGADHIGGIVGSAESTDITDTHATIDVTISNGSEASYVGGFAGSICQSEEGCSTTGSSWTGDISINTDGAIANVGGFFGKMGPGADGTTVSDSHALGSITLTSEGDAISGIGGLIGYSKQDGTTLMHDVSYAGDITLRAAHNIAFVGGLIGDAQAIDLDKGYSTGTISIVNNPDNLSDGEDYIAVKIGGLLGKTDGRVKNSFSRTNLNITATNNGSSFVAGQEIGGLIGSTEDPDIEQTYSSGHITLTAVAPDTVFANFGGLIGLVQISGEAGVLNSFTASHISLSPGGATDASMGSLIGLKTGTGFFSNNFYDVARVGLGANSCITTPNGEVYTTEDTAGACEGVNADGMDANHFFNSDSNSPFKLEGTPTWNFEDIWQTHAGDYPTLSGQDLISFSPTASFDGGDGLSDDTAYEISTCRQLQAIGQDDAHLAAHYKLTTDVDCSSTSLSSTANLAFDPLLYNNGKGFIPIGADEDHPFSGTINATTGNGGSYIILGLVIHRSNQEGVGLFGYVDGATIRNVGIEGEAEGDEDVGLLAGSIVNSTLYNVGSSGFGGLVQGRQDVGGLIGTATRTSIDSISFNGNVYGIHNSSYVGGIVGDFLGDDDLHTNDQIGISNAIFSGEVSIGFGGSQYMGGIAGYLEDGFINNGTVIGVGGDPAVIDGSDFAYEVGGLVGAADHGLITNSTSAAIVTGFGDVGGLVGEMENTTIDGSSSTINVFGGTNDSRVSWGFNFGGLVGYSDGGDTITNSHSSADVMVYAGNGGVVAEVGGLMGEVCGDSGNCSIHDDYATGAVSVQFPTGAAPEQDVYDVGGFAGAFYGGHTEEGDIFVSDDAYNNNATGNVSITNEDGDGSNHDIEDVGGFLGESNNVNFTDSYATGNVTVALSDTDGVEIYRIGGFAGEIDDYTLFARNYAEGDITISASDVPGNAYAGKTGGLIGFVDNGLGSAVQKSYATGDISTAVGYTEQIGGLIGTTHTSVRRSYATGSVTIDGISDGYSENIGGLVGELNGGSVADSYANGTLSTSNMYNIVAFGGLIGITDEGATVRRTYASGAIMADSLNINRVGGLIGTNNATVEDNFSATAVTLSGGGSENQIGGFQGFNDTGTLSRNYFDENTSGQSVCSNWDDFSPDECMGIDTPDYFKNTSTAQPFDQSESPVWDFVNVWKINTTDYPTFQLPSAFSVPDLVNATVTTEDATDITATTATLNGTVADDGGNALDSGGFEYGLVSDGGYTDTITTGEGFLAPLTELICGSDYHYRGFVVDGDGIIYYGGEATFSTATCPDLSVAFRYIKWDVTKRKGAVNAIQAAEFTPLLSGTPIDLSGATADNPGGSNEPDAVAPYFPQNASAGIDANISTKWLDENFTDDNAQTTGDSSLILDAGDAHTFTFEGYRWTTAEDYTGRDPVSWSVYGSDDGVEWTLLDSRTDETITDNRQTVTSDYALDGDRTISEVDRGDGTTDHPYLITTCSQIEDINTDDSTLSASYTLMRSLDCTGEGDGIIIAPGEGMAAFTGVFDGNGHSIKIAIDGESSLVNGLFGAIQDGTVRDLTIAEGSTVTGNFVTGGLAGLASGATILRVTSHATVTNPITTFDSEFIGTGGLVGIMSDSRIMNSSFDGDVSAAAFAGGLVGLDGALGDSATTSSIIRSWNTGTIHGVLGMGGLVGLAAEDTLSITDSYSAGDIAFDASFMGDVPQADGFGGIVGLSEGNHVIINRTYSAGTITKSLYDALPSSGILGVSFTGDVSISNSWSATAFLGDGSFSGIVTDAPENLTLTNNYYDAVASGIGSGLCTMADGDVTGECESVDTTSDADHFKNTEDAPPMDQWNFDTVWSTVSDDYPILQAFVGDTVVTAPGRTTITSHIPSRTPEEETGQMDLSWAAPDEGGSPITDYDIEYKIVGDPSFTMWSHAPSTDTEALITGLTVGARYEFLVAAVNGEGTGGADSATSYIGDVPGDFTASATPGNGSVTVNWVPPVDNGGTPVQSYSIYSRFHAEAGSYTLVTSGISSDSTEQLLTDLSNDTSYDFKVVAINFNGLRFSNEVTDITPVPTGSPVYSIASCADLQSMRFDLSSSYVMTTDVDCTGTTFNPIGNADTPFEGTFNGQGHLVTHLAVNVNHDYAGLFGDVGTSGIIENVGLPGADVTGSCNTGALAGTNDGIVRTSFATGEVEGQCHTGGLVGTNSATGTIMNSYTRNDVNAGAEIGGIAGHNDGTIANVYATGLVDGAEYFSGLVGIDASEGGVTNSFWDAETSGNSGGGPGTHKTTSEMTDGATFTNLATDGLATPWDFIGNPNDDTAADDIWGISEFYNHGYAYLAWQNPTLPTSTLVAHLAFNELSGTDAADSTGYGNNGSALDGTSWITGKFGNGLHLDGTTHVAIADPHFIPIGHQSYTISAWFKTDGYHGAQGIIGWGNYGSMGQVNALRLSYYGECPNSYGFRNYWWNNDIDACTDTNIFDNAWHMVTATYDGTTRKIFLDGVELNSDTPSAPSIPDASNFAIGITNDIEPFNGSLDDVRVYASALDGSAITDLYTANDDGEGGLETTPPEAPTSFTADVSGSTVNLSWTNPANDDFDSAVIRRSTSGYPATVEDGTLVASGLTETNRSDSGLSNATYYYGLFALDTNNNVSAAAHASAIVNVVSSGGGGGGGGISYSPPSVQNQTQTQTNNQNTDNGSGGGTGCLPGYNFSPLTGQKCPVASPPQTKPQTPPASVQGGSSYYVFTRNLKQGISGDDVRHLQIFLNTHGFPVNPSGPGSLGHETTLFRDSTWKALLKYQEAYPKEILVPQGISKGTGNFFSYTRKYVNDLLAKGK